ncbi:MULTISPECIES: type III secretion protein HrpB2 [Xanthomonas translucens group]|uniref:Type III secretion protein HrpB2 n=4 Tax=Xanthomonas translucens group TaxID=3390202 RepID=A0A109HR14_XANCT|nr:type III secretion protein HrpB2 [Xanthomonas translucens]KTF38743.1 type III secretion protein HrpB2 [Xanthomonas translucens pv. translucens]KWV12052.1 type III secretion protein HrpB2 [Xanthomonas translucens]KWV16661.1 type III secretion protein HrpB2 [Xanthomonas translucens]MCC8447599.1 type III secretion protein HrpB2 [Xanthomonas translucens pv. translucens]MCS3360735.1 type III secretion protein HrpB2 [Xanthomonas translucens pv. translucens]
MTPIAPISPVTAATTGSAAAPVPAAPSAASVHNFQALMQQGHRVAPDLQISQHPTAIGRLVGAEDKAMKTVMDQAEDFAARAPTMDMAQLAAGQVQMMDRMTVTMLQLNIGTAVAQGGKSAVQTLFKNQ